MLLWFRVFVSNFVDTEGKAGMFYRKLCSNFEAEQSENSSCSYAHW